MKKACLIANIGFTITNFRSEFVAELKERGFEVKIICPNDNDFNTQLNNIGVDIIHIPLERRGLNPFKDVKTFFALLKILKREKPYVVYSYTIKPVIYGSIAAYLTKIPQVFSNITGLGHIFTTHNLKTMIIRNILFWLYRFALSLNTKVFFQNVDDRDLFIDLKLVKNNNSKVINGSGINLEKFKSSSLYSKVPQSFILIGRLIKEKGISEFIEAIRIVKLKYPKVTCLLVGDIDENPTSYSRKEINNWSDKEGVITYLGRVDDVRPLLDKTEVFVLPSYREGTPRSVLEAMSMGLPIITTDSPGCRGTVIHGKNGFLVPVKDSNSLAEAMINFLKEPELIEKMGKNSLDLVKEKYDVSKVNLSILDELESTPIISA